MVKISSVAILPVLLAGSVAWAEVRQEAIVGHDGLMDHGDGHWMDMEGGMVMGQNTETLPGGCNRISEDVEITVRAGHKYAKDYPGTMFGFDRHEWRVKPCARLTVHFVNEDHVRHQWMLHGLPKYMYYKGMFHLEVTGPAKISGTMILPPEDKTYMVHCDIAQHMEKGMKGQLIVGAGSGTFPTIPGLTDAAVPDIYPQLPSAVSRAATAEPASATGSGEAGSLLLGVLLGLFAPPLLLSLRGKYFKGMSVAEILVYFGSLGETLLERLFGMLKALLGRAGKSD